MPRNYDDYEYYPRVHDRSLDDAYRNFMACSTDDVNLVADRRSTRCEICGHTFTCTYPPAGQGVQCPQCNVIHAYTCPRCNTFTPVSRMVHSVPNGLSCRDCWSQRFCNCGHCGREVALSNVHQANDQRLCSRCFQRHWFVCRFCNGTFDRHALYRGPNDEPVCSDCFESRYFSCDSCGDIICDGDEVENDNGTYCPRCARNLQTWEPDTFTVDSPTFTRVGSERCFGIELETSSCARHRELRELTTFGVKTDCSIEGLEFVSPVLYGDEGLREIETICNFAGRNHWGVNRYCGYHVHFDMRQETPVTLQRIAYAYSLTYNMWTRFITDQRAHSNYCAAPDYNANDILQINTETNEDWDYFVGARDRFEYVNWRAYLSHGTFEVRLYEGTLDATTIINWLLVHIRFIDAVSKLGLVELGGLFDCSITEQFENLKTLVGNELADYWNNRADTYGKRIGTLSLVLTPPF